MKQLHKNLIILLLLHSQYYSACESNTSFYSQWDIQMHNPSIEVGTSSKLVNFFSALDIGFCSGNYCFFVRPFADYFSYSSKYIGDNIDTARFDYGLGIANAFHFLPWLDMEFVLGSCVRKSAIRSSVTEWTSFHQLGLYIEINPAINLPFADMRFSLQNRFSIFEDFSNLVRADFNILYPYYNLKARLEAFNFFGFLSVYAEAGGIVWGPYKMNFSSFQNGLYSAGVGMIFHLAKRTPYVLEQKAGDQNTSILQPDTNRTLTVLKENLELNETKTIEKDPLFLKLLNAKKQEIIIIDNILFDKKTDKLTKNSLILLQPIADAMKENKAIVISISSYSEFFGNPKTEFELSEKRAIMVQEFLVKSGIDKNRIRISSFGTLYIPDNPKTTRSVQIEVLKK